MTVMSLDHAYRRAHLLGQCMDIHAVVHQSKRGIGVAQAVEYAVITRLGANKQTILAQERFEGLA